MDLENAIHVELAYHINKYLSANDLGIEEFAESCGLSAATVTMAVNRADIPVSDMVKVCDKLGILLNELRYPPKNEPQYTELSSKFWSICTSDLGAGEKRQAALLVRQNTTLDAQTWERYITWLKYEVTGPKDNWQQHKPKLRKGKRMTARIPIQHFASAAFIRKISPKRERWLKSIIEESKKK